MKGFMKLTLLFLAAFAAFGQSTAASKFRLSSDATLPATCAVGDLFEKTGTGAGVYRCSATDTWSAGAVPTTPWDYCAPSGTTGTPSAYTCTLATASTLEAGLHFIFKPDVNSAGTTPTLNVNGTGVKNLYGACGSSCVIYANDLGSGSVAEVVYDGAAYRVVAGQLNSSGNSVFGTSVAVGAQVTAASLKPYRFLGEVNSPTCAASAVTISATYTHNRVNLGDQATCVVTWASGTAEQFAVVRLCHGASTATTTLTWPANVKGGIAAAGGTSTCMVQTFVYDGTRAEWLATSAGISGL